MDLDQERPRIPRAQDDLFRPGVSARAKYQAMVVGRPGLGALLRHELVVLVAQVRSCGECGVDVGREVDLGHERDPERVGARDPPADLIGGVGAAGGSSVPAEHRGQRQAVTS